MTAVTGAKPHPIFLAGTLGRIGRSARRLQPGRSGQARRLDVPRDRGPVRGGRRGGRRGLRGHPDAARLRARARSSATSAPGSRRRREELGRLLATEAGKPIRDALVEVDRAVLTFRLGAEEAERMVGETIPLDLMPASKGRVGITRRFPIGPIAGISPFNFPLNLAAHKVSPAIASGQPDRPQAAVQGPAGDAHGGRDHRGGRRAGRIGERPADEPRARRPDGRRRPVQAPDLHRQPVGRLADEGAGGQEAGRPRARRQRRRDRRQDGRPRLGRPSDARRGVLVRRARSASASSGCSSTRTSGTRSWRSSSRARRR